MTAARSAVNMVSAFRSILAWSLLGVIMGFALFSLVLLSLVGARLRGRAARTVIERAASLYLWCSPLYRISVRGREHLPASGSYVLVANHESGLDGACLMVLAPRGRFLATSWLFRTPIIGFVMRSCEHIPERRHTAPEGPVEAMSMALRAGTNVVVFPEGEYGCSAVAPLRRGAFVAAR
ncbi:MAG: lysophospholipid acyltransferase family protein, partial [Pseudomonadota bacterium]